MFIGYDTECWHLIESSVQEAIGLRCNHEESDTRFFLHAKNVAEEGYEAIVIISEDTYVFVLAVSNSYHIKAQIYQRRETQVCIARRLFTILKYILAHFERYINSYFS